MNEVLVGDDEFDGATWVADRVWFELVGGRFGDAGVFFCARFVALD